MEQFNQKRKALNQLMSENDNFFKTFGDLDDSVYSDGAIPKKYKEFNNLEINRIEAEVMQGNVASEAVLGKLGFKNEGVLRQWMYWNGNHYDMTMFSLLIKDYHARD